MASNTNVAYDFSRFEAPEPRKKPEPRPQIKVVAGKQTRPKTSPLPKLCLAILMVAMIVMIIYNQVMLSELSSKIGTAQSKLTSLQSESTRLSAQLTGVSSSRALEEAATSKLGLTKLDSSQMVYVNMQEKDYSEITAKGKKKTGGEKISGTAGEIMEYLKLK